MSSGESRKNTGWMLALCVSVLAVGGCAPQAADTHAVDEDPWSGFNHAVYEFNYAFDGAVLKPITQIYRGIVPEEGRELVSNFLDNLYTPVTFANSVLQADPQNSFASFWRFAINTTFGIGGLFDVASEAGLKNRTADFGQTLALYGVESGPYLVLPILGPSNARDAVGHLADAFLNPFNYLGTGESAVIWSATAVDKRSRNMKLLDDIYSSSLDPYSTFRSGYTQKRVSDIHRARESRDKALEKAGNPQ